MNQVGNRIGTGDKAREVDVPQFVDSRGRLAVFERLHPLPFKPVRAFVISEVPKGEHRARHTVPCNQFLWMAAGSCWAVVRADEQCDAADQQRFRLTANGRGLYLPRGVWIDLYEFTAGSILICLADAEYVARV
ncbi:MAG TPA: FdtA/QdtA family cupin domain-containing protein [Dongiaceae bacterium]|nr:FdtA/QdtA family cupin domain-containing protein [Dongiaceae bacterium]